MRNKLIKLKRYRKEKGLTREQMAKALEISKFTYRSYEQGDRELKLGMLKKITEVLGCTIDEII